tara:strand:+ start:325 stop:1014 length:690 start_codon:yes stop_codon:yes gene_type:complete
MASENSSNSGKNGQNPYSDLGLSPDASFDQIQKAKEDLLKELGDDSIAKAKVESSYDAILMESLKERQLGKLSKDALTASKKEEKFITKGTGESGSLITRLKNFNASSSLESNSNILPELSLPDGQGLTLRIVLGLLAFLLVLVSPSSDIQIILSLSTIGVFISLVKRSRKVLSSLGWSVVLLSVGLIIGGIISNGQSSIINSQAALSLSQIEALPAVLLLWLGSLLIV